MANTNSKSDDTKNTVFAIAFWCCVLSWVAIVVAGLSHHWNILHILLALAFLSGVVAAFTASPCDDYDKSAQSATHRSFIIFSIRGRIKREDNPCDQAEKQK